MAGDIYYNNVSLLLHCDGTDGSTTFTDNSPTPKTITPSGNAQISTAQSKFGGASALFDGTGDYITSSNPSDFAFGTGDFTIEAWVYHTNNSTYQIVYTGDGNVATLENFSIRLDSHTTSQIIVSISSAILFNSVGNIPLNTWTQITFCRSGSNNYLFVNGTQVGSTVTNSDSITCATGYPALGGHSNTAGYIGYIDEIRVTKGIARYTSNFTVPTEAFGNSTPPKTIVGNIPVTTTVAATFNRKTNIVGNIPVTTTVAATFNNKTNIVGNTLVTITVAAAIKLRKKAPPPWGPGMVGMNNQTGRHLGGLLHLKQSIMDILLTPLGTRVMRRDYGSRLFELIDAPMNSATIIAIVAATAEALAKWEPRIAVERVTLDEGNATGRIGLTLYGKYLPDGQQIKMDGIIL